MYFCFKQYQENVKKETKAINKPNIIFLFSDQNIKAVFALGYKEIKTLTMLELKNISMLSENNEKIKALFSELIELQKKWEISWT